MKSALQREHSDGTDLKNVADFVLYLDKLLKVEK